MCIRDRTGGLKDRPYVDELLDLIQEEEMVSVGKTIPYVNLPNTKGTQISRTTSKTHHDTASDFFRKLYDKGEFIEKT